MYCWAVFILRVPGTSWVSHKTLNPLPIPTRIFPLSANSIMELITGESLQGKVSFIGRAPDDATRTYPVEVTVPSPGSGLRAGLSAEMRVPVGRELAHLISPASLVLSDDGIVGVRIVDAADTVRFRAVDIVSESPDGVWVKGLPNRVKLITIGQEDVFEGQVVRIDLTPLTAVVRS